MKSTASEPAREPGSRRLEITERDPRGLVAELRARGESEAATHDYPAAGESADSKDFNREHILGVVDAMTRDGFSRVIVIDHTDLGHTMPPADALAEMLDRL